MVPSASSAGVVYVRVTTSTGTSAANSASAYTYTIAAAVPTLSEWGMILLVTILAGAGYWMLQRQRNIGEAF